MANSINLWGFAGVVLALLLIGLAFPNPSWAQKEPGVAAIGIEIGQIGGVTGTLYRPNQSAYDALLTTDANEVFTLFLHRLRSYPFPDSEVYGYYGPGLFVGGRTLNTDPTSALGLSGRVGLKFYSERFEAFLQVTPTLRLHPSLDPSLAGSVGLRYTLFSPQ